MKKITGITINYNSEEETVSCLKSLAKLDLSNIDFSILIVDNDSNKESQEYIDAHLAKTTYDFPVTYIKNTINSGFSGGNNLGIKKALAEGAEYILILNNDTEVEKNLLQELVKILEEHPKVGIVSPKIYFMKGSEFHKDRYQGDDLGKVIWYAGGVFDRENVIGTHIGVDEVDTGQYEQDEATDFATGCCMLIRREVFETTGYFDEMYFLYYEDIDLCFRAKMRKYDIFFAPSAIMWHKNAGSTGGSGSALQDYFISRNRLLFGFRYSTLRTKLALIKESAKFMLNGREWQKKGITDYFLHKFGKGSYKA